MACQPISINNMKRIYLAILALCFAYGVRAQTIGGSTLVCPGSTVNYTSAQAGDWTVTGGTIVGTVTGGVAIQWSSSPGSGLVRLSWEEPVNNGDMISKTISLAVTINSPIATNGSVNSLSVCSGSGGQVNLSGFTGTILKWQSSTNNGASWNDISNTTYTQSFSSVTTATQFRAYIAGPCNNAYSAAGTVSVIAPTVGGTAQGDATVYNGAYFSKQIDLVNQTGTVVQWEKSINAGASWTVINATTTSLAYSSQNLGQTTQFRALVKNQTCASQYSSVATVTVLPLIQGVTQACPDVEYHYNLGAYVSNPVWSIQGGQIVRQDDETSIYVVWEASIYNKVLGVEFVTGVVNGETLTDGRSLTVSMNSIARGGVPTGPGTVCAGDAATLTLQNYTGTILRWEAQSATTWQSLGGAGSSTFAVVPTGTQSFRAVIDGSVCGEKYSSSLPVSTILRPQVSVSPGARFGAGALSLSATSDLPLASFSWFSQPASGTPLFTGATYQPVVSQSQVYYVEADNAGCKSSVRALANASVYAMPQILFNGAAGNQAPFSFYQGDAAVLSTSEGYDQYQWTRNGINLSSQNQVTVSQAGSYSLTVTRGTATATTAATIQYYNTPGALNYVKEYSPLKEGATAQAQVISLGVTEVQKQISYIDGLGKEQQHILIAASPNQHDIVQVKEYDPLGRESKSYLPYADQAGDGLYKLNARKRAIYSTGDQFGFYNGNSSMKVAVDTQPFSETILEASPLNRPLQDFGPGQNWRSANRYTGHQYLANQPNEIWQFTFDTSTGLVSAGAGSTGYYNAGELSAKVTTDEQGNDIIEYTDKQGRVVCKKVQYQTDGNGVKQYTSTYYLYDDLGHLVVVLPPEAVKKIISQLN
jgi:hypothetical protein